MDFLRNLLESSPLPVLSAFLLGLMVAVGPCTMTANISAIGYIARDISNQGRVFLNGFIYTLGRGISYTIVGFLFYFGASQFEISAFLQIWGEKIFGPLLILIGFFMFDFINISIPGFGFQTEKMEKKPNTQFFDVLLLGIVFALAFCSYSGVLYFGMLIPMTISSARGLYLPMIFALATGIPVIVFSWIIAFSIKSIGKVYNKIKAFEYWFRRVVAVLFIGIGIYYVIVLFIL